MKELREEENKENIGMQQCEEEKKEAENQLLNQGNMLAKMKLELEEKAKLLEEKTELAKEYHTSLQYLRADFENLKKFLAKEKAEYIKSANEELVKKLLPVLDSFESALKIKEAEGSQLIREGIERIYRQLYEILEKEGLKPITAIGNNFDPLKHEAIAQSENSDCEENIILEEYQKGYVFNSKVIRTSKVKVSKR